MKKTKNKISLLVLLITSISISFAQQKPIPSQMFGINWHLPDSVGVIDAGGQVNNMIDKISQAHPQLIRIGGNAYDQDGATNYQIGKACDSIIYQLDAEPLVQIPIYKKFGDTVNTFNYTPQDALDLLDYLNSKGYNIKYIALGNEPDLYPDLDDSGIDSIASKFLRFIPVLKSVYPNLKVVV